MKKYIYILLLMAASSAFWGCSGEKSPETLEAKKKALSEYKKELIELKQKINVLENDIQALSIEKGLRKPAVGVKAKTLEPRRFKHYIQIPGNVESDDYVKVSSEVPGMVVALNVEVGDYVTKGKVLARLDDKMIRKQLEELETSLDLARQQYEKQSRLWNQGIGSEMQYLQAKNAFESIEKRMETLQAQLDKYLVKAPISGVIDDVMIKKGEMASPGLPLLAIVDAANIKVVGEVSERYVGKFHKGDSVVVEFPVIGKKIHTVIDAVGEAIDKSNRTFKVIIKIDNRSGELKPNLLANIQLFDFKKENALVVPTRIIFFQDEGNSLYTVAISNGDTLARKTRVELEYSDERQSLIAKGLKAGDVVITEGYDKISDGERVKVIQ